MAEVIFELIGYILESDELFEFLWYGFKMIIEIVVLPFLNVFRRLFAFKISTLLF